jgi:rhodanese-related sulfurtransferase
MSPQKTKFRQYLETSVNISLIAACLVFVGVLAKTYFAPSTAAVKKIQTGDTISFPDSTWEKGQKSLLLFLQSDCQYCTKSADFYVEIAKETAHVSNAKIVAVFSEKDTRFADYLKELGLQNLETRKTGFAKSGIEGTPTLVLVNDNGIVQNIWKGMLSPKKQIEVKQNLDLQITDWFIEEAEVSDLKKKGQTITIVDVRDREFYAMKHFADAKNIPMDELYIRAVNELSLSDTVIIYGISDDEGADAQEILAREGFRKVYILRYKFS